MPHAMKTRAMRRAVCAYKPSTGLGISVYAQRRPSRCDRCLTPPVARAASAEAPDPAQPETVEWSERISAIKIFKRAWAALKPVVWPAVWLFVAQTLFIMLVDRFTHRLVNASFLQFAGSKFTEAEVGRLWWLSQNPEVTSFATGYNWISYGLSIATFPLSAAANCVCICALYRLAAPHIGLGRKELTAPAQKPPSATLADHSGVSAAEASEESTEEPEQGAADDGRAGSKFSARKAPGDKADETKHASVADAIAAKTDTPSAGKDAEAKAADAKAPPPAPAKKRDRLAALKGAWTASSQAIHADFKRVYLACLLVSAAEYALIHVSNMIIYAPLLLGPLVIGWQLAMPFACLDGTRGAAALARSWRWIRKGRMLAATGIALSTVFILELAAPFLIYVTLSVVPQRVVVAVPELMAAMLVASQGVVCVLAQMRYLLPLVLFKAAKQPPPAAAAAVEVA